MQTLLSFLAKRDEFSIVLSLGCSPLGWVPTLHFPARSEECLSSVSLTVVIPAFLSSMFSCHLHTDHSISVDMFSGTVSAVTFSVGDRSVCCPSCNFHLKTRPCSVHQQVKAGPRAQASGITPTPVALVGSSRFGQVPLTSASVLYSKGHIDLPHRGVVRINKCWYRALEIRRCCVMLRDGGCRASYALFPLYS